MQVVLVGGKDRCPEPPKPSVLPSPQPTHPRTLVASNRMGLYLGQLDSQCHLEALHPHLHGQHIVVACGAPGAVCNTSCGDRGV